MKAVDNKIIVVLMDWPKFKNTTLMILSFRSRQKVETQIRLLLEEQSDQGLHCLLFHLRLFDKISLGLACLFEF